MVIGWQCQAARITGPPFATDNERFANDEVTIGGRQ